MTDDLDHLRAQLFADRIQYIIDEIHLLKNKIDALILNQKSLHDRIYNLEKNPKVVYKCSSTEQPWAFPYK